MHKSLCTVPLRPIGYGDQINLYAYVGNDQVNNTDPTGEDMEEITTIGHMPDYQPPSFASLSQLMATAAGLDASAAANNQGADGKGDGKKGDSDKCLAHNDVNDTAKEALKKYNPVSKAWNSEFGGNIYRNWLGSYGYSVKRGTQTNVIIDNPKLWQKRVGIWHTHGRSNGDPVQNIFSPPDIMASERLGAPSFLGTPNDSLLVYDPSNKTTRSYDDLKGGCK